MIICFFTLVEQFFLNKLLLFIALVHWFCYLFGYRSLILKIEIELKNMDIQFCCSRYVYFELNFLSLFAFFTQVDYSFFFPIIIYCIGLFLLIYFRIVISFICYLLGYRSLFFKKMTKIGKLNRYVIITLLVAQKFINCIYILYRMATRVEKAWQLARQ